MLNLPTTDSFKITIVSRETGYESRQISKLKTTAGFAQSVKRLTAERKVSGSISGAGPLLLRVLK